MSTLDLVMNILDAIMAIWLVLAIVAACWQVYHAAKGLHYLLNVRLKRGVWHVYGGLDLRSIWIDDCMMAAYRVGSFALIPAVWVSIPYLF